MAGHDAIRRFSIDYHSFVIVSSRFSTTRASAVQAARSAGVDAGGNLACRAACFRRHAAAAAKGRRRPRLNRFCCSIEKLAAGASSSSACGSRDRHRANGVLRAARRRSRRRRPRTFRASARAHSRNSGSFSVVSACSGVFDRARRTQAISPIGASKVLQRRIRHRPEAERVQRRGDTCRARVVRATSSAVARRRLEQELRRRRINAGAADLRDSAARWPPARCRGRSPRRRGTAARGPAAGCPDRGASSSGVDDARLLIGRRVTISR